jgi:hypothetical protein
VLPTITKADKLSQVNGDKTEHWFCGYVMYWQIITANRDKAGSSWGCLSAFDSRGRTIWIADAHRDDGKLFVVHADEKLTANRRLAKIVLTLSVRRAQDFTRVKSVRRLNRRGLHLTFFPQG